MQCHKKRWVYIKKQKNSGVRGRNVNLLEGSILGGKIQRTCLCSITLFMALNHSCDVISNGYFGCSRLFIVATLSLKMEAVISTKLA